MKFGGGLVGAEVQQAEQEYQARLAESAEVRKHLAGKEQLLAAEADGKSYGLAYARFIEAWRNYCAINPIEVDPIRAGSKRARTGAAIMAAVVNFDKRTTLGKPVKVLAEQDSS